MTEREVPQNTYVDSGYIDTHDTDMLDQLRSSRNASGQRQIGHRAIRYTRRPFESGDPKTGQESHLSGIDDYLSPVTKDEIRQLHQNMDARSLEGLNTLRNDLTALLNDPNHESLAAARLRAQIEKREKDLKARNALPEGYVPLIGM